MVNKKMVLTAAPHIKSEMSTRGVMLDVIIALFPAFCWSVVAYGRNSFVLVFTGIISCVLFEYLFCLITKKKNTIGDCSAIVTGILLAFNLPDQTPLWMVVIGSFFAIVVVKQIFGGLGQNFMNPALAARAFLFSWPSEMTTFTKPFSNGIDAVTTATPLSFLKNGELPEQSVRDMFMGVKAGCIGEISAVLLILGGIYLLIRKVITWHIPVAYIGTVALITFFFPKTSDGMEFMLYSIFSGGLMLGAIFMATDYVTSPVSNKGKVIFGIGCGLLTVFIRYFGGYPEGVSYSILLMNACVWMIDKKFIPRPFGTPKKTYKFLKVGGGNKNEEK
mgnify:CR=1 FL=1